MARAARTIVPSEPRGEPIKTKATSFYLNFLRSHQKYRILSFTTFISLKLGPY